MLYGWLAALYGVLLSAMNTLNADLAEVYGNWASTVIIHFVGLIVLAPFAFRWGRRKARSPWYLHLGGVIGIVTVVFVNVGVSGIGVTGNLVLMLLGQVSSSALVDHLGLMGARVYHVNRQKLLALALMALGGGAMLLLSRDGVSGASVMAALLSFLSGCTMVSSRMVNAALAARSGVGYSTTMNYATGQLGSAAVFVCLGMPMAAPFPAEGQSLLLYLGGALGAAGILLSNVVTPRLPALQMSVIVFVGQVFSGMVIDGLSGRFSAGILVGGLLVAAGMLVNARADARKAE